MAVDYCNNHPQVKQRMIDIGLNESQSIGAEGIKDIILSEELLYQKCLEKGEKICKKNWPKISEISGEDLSYLHQTHGIDLETVEGIYDESLTKQQKIDYELVYNEHKKTGKEGLKREVIKICE